MGDKPDFDALAVIDAVGPMIGIPIAPDYREGIATNLKITAEFAETVLAFHIDDANHSAPVFEA
ncbi:hypothetical protein GCM10007874_18190 [Labrys miyagiensis]|uniref:Uncharacterized protein n=1 Tax=Labrys miyagiensis TaxID=346912 RepID=A0ABQ6CGP3_9HYPH|nr:DUF4089 domain-containing protein [Labrys miyagiensis]GLS18802.1 hypothetical protein GCM10007874_18190 [Labrys miyagiensis]